MIVKIKYLILGFLFAVVMIGGVTVLASANYKLIKVEENKFKCYIDQKEIVFPKDNESFLHNNKLYVPLKFYSERLGKTVLYDKESSTINIKTPGANYGASEKQTQKLKKEDFDFLKKGMTFEEIYREVGPAAENIGSGVPILVYNLDDGSKILLNFAGGTLHHFDFIPKE